MAVRGGLFLLVWVVVAKMETTTFYSRVHSSGMDWYPISSPIIFPVLSREIFLYIGILSTGEGLFFDDFLFSFFCSCVIIFLSILREGNYG